MNSSSGSATSSSCGPSNSDHRRKGGPGKKDLAKLIKWKINPASIEFNRGDVTSESSSVHSGVQASSKGKSETRSYDASSSKHATAAATALASIGNEGFPDSDSDSDLGDLDEAGLDAQEWQMLEQQQQQRPTVALTQDQLGQVPLDTNGNPSSIGSLGHLSGQCQPCVFFTAPTGCTNGISCTFCHLPHKPGKRKNKMRPCKGKRDRYRKLLSRLTQQVEQDPDGFNADNLELPPSISSNEASKAKLMARMDLIAEQVRAQRIASATGASSSGQPASAAGPASSSQAGGSGLPAGRRRDTTSIVSL